MSSSREGDTTGIRHIRFRASSGPCTAVWPLSLLLLYRLYLVAALAGLQEDAAQILNIGNALNGDHEGSPAHFDVFGLGIIPNSLEVTLHNVDQTAVVLSLRPEATLKVLSPLEVGADNSAGVRQEIGNNHNAFVR